MLASLRRGVDGWPCMVGDLRDAKSNLVEFQKSEHDSSENNEKSNVYLLNFFV